MSYSDIFMYLIAVEPSRLTFRNKNDLLISDGGI